MILYHGSYMAVPEPDIIHSRKRVDFGCGFYTTPLYEQAVKWCMRFSQMKNPKPCIVSHYEFDENAFDKLNVLRFDAYSEDWLDFVMQCRLGTDDTDYDIVLGGVANDKVFNTVELYLSDLIDKKEAIKRLQYEKPNMQICFRKQEVIDTYLRFEGSGQI